MDGSKMEFAFSDAQFDEVARFASENFGLQLEASKKQLVYSRLTRRLRKLKLSGFHEYIELVKSDAAHVETQNLLSALTTNVTQFMREAHHFEFLEKVYFHELANKARNGERIRLWSAGCSQGQEAYSLAFSLLSCFPDAARFDVKILATDIDPTVLHIAQGARYPKDQAANIMPAYADKYTIQSSDGESFQVSSEVRQLISFAQLNLIDDWPMRGDFDLIMCRNVAIYFSTETQNKLWQRFANALKPAAILQIGHSERISGSALQSLEAAGITTYRKTQHTQRGN